MQADRLINIIAALLAIMITTLFYIKQLDNGDITIDIKLKISRGAPAAEQSDKHTRAALRQGDQ